MDQSPMHNQPLEAQADGQVQNEFDEIINPSQILEDENLNNINPFPTFEDKQEPIKRFKMQEETQKKDQQLIDPNINIKPASILQFYKYIPLKHKILLIVATSLALLQSLALPVYTIVIGRIALQLDPNLTTQEIYDNVCLLAIVLGIAAGASFFITLIFLSLFMHIGENVGYIYRTKFLEAILTQDMKWYDKQQIASFPTKIQELSSQIQTAAGDKLGQCIHDCTMPLFSLAVSFYMFWQLSFVLLGAYPFLLLSSIIFTKSIQNRAKSKARSQECISSQAEEVLLGIKTVIAFNGQEQEERLFNEAARDVKNQGIKDQNHFAIGSGVYFFFMFCFYSFTIYIGSLFILENLKDRQGDKYKADAIFTVLFSFVFSTFNLSRALPNLKYVFEAKVALAKINQIINNERTIDYQSGEPVTSCSGNIEFRNIYFNYPSKPEIPVLKDISFQVESGQKIAVCGESGSGKSTIIQLLQRFYDPDQGTILIDGRDVKTINFSQMRKFISIVSQEPVLFNTSIRDNIRFSKPDASQAEIENAAKLANAHNFIVDKLSEGYETQVGSGGSLLSGGEKQRIAIARAVLKDLKILILDEATSALDQNNEKEVQSSLDQISSQIKFTSIIIAHRISTIRNADTIYVLSKGELKEFGTHDQLIEKKNIYAALVEAQKLQEKKDSEKMSKKDIMSEKASTYKQLSQYQDRETQSKNEDKKQEFNFDVVISTEDKELIDKNQENLQGNVENLQQQNQGKKKKPKVINSQVMRRLGKINKSKIWLIPTGVFAALVNGVVFPTFSIILVEAMARISIPDRDKFREETSEVSLYFLIFAVVKFIAFMVQSLCLGYFSEYLTEKLRIITFKKLLYHDVQEFDKKPPSILSNTLANETILINSAAGTTLPWFTEGICSLIGGLIVSLIYSWAIGLVFIGFAPLMVICSVLMMKQIKG